MTPYYDEDGITIYHGDCRDVLPSLVSLGADIITDPPYGIGADRIQQERALTRRGRAAALSRDYGDTDWDRPIDQETLELVLNVGRHHIIWGGNYFSLPPSRGWLVWDKETGGNGYADCELAWTDLPTAVRMFRFRWMGMLQEIPEERHHPTQKPLPLMRWCIEKLPDETRLILDPFMGSGTTLRAAADSNRQAIGIEIEEKYCEIAVQRLAQGVLEFK